MTAADEFQLVLATNNAGKVEEMRVLLSALPVRVLAGPDISGAPVVDENGVTLADNALKKARAFFGATRQPSLADDTGLMVRALGGLPGVHSARYAGPQSDDRANRALLLDSLLSVQDRAARFSTVLAYVDAQEHRFFEGVCDGEITVAERGKSGFGYDQIFRPAGSDKTFAEMSATEKNHLSHRGKALRAFQAYLSTLLQ